MWPRTPSVDREMKTCCHICRAEQAVCHPRAMYMSDTGASTGYESKTCLLCDGSGWLPGRMSPA